ncbi:MAG TPA: hypothetical protein VFH68_09900 [Polyangia bacterium]|jgi:hypothetical protein|nr:hypothetical protein [Polyangia bacterium]
MVVLSRLDVAFKVGFFALAAGAMLAACGSITVLEPDGGPGAGGTIASGTGGGHGGATGGRNGGGGTIGGGVGGIIGGLGGLFGGTGGSPGIGGSSGGVGGRNGGSIGGSPGIGGSSGGIGGRTGGTGGTTAGTGGSSGTTCGDIQRNFATALAEAKVCTMSSQCLLLTNDRLECGCPTSVTRTDKVESYRQAWIQSGCSSGVCAAILCTVVSGGSCTAGTSGYTCVDQGAGLP